MLTFHEWKQQQIASDTAANNGLVTFKERDWYYRHYGLYCAAYRRKHGWT